MNIMTGELALPEGFSFTQEAITQMATQSDILLMIAGEVRSDGGLIPLEGLEQLASEYPEIFELRGNHLWVKNPGSTIGQKE